MNQYSLQLSLFQNDYLEGQTIAITGRLSISRREAISLVKYSKGVYRTTVSRLTTVLVVGQICSKAADGYTKKLRSAMQINARDPDHILIIDQDKFYNLLFSGNKALKG